MGCKYFNFTGHAIPSSLQFFLSRQHAMQGYAGTLLCKNITHMHKHTKKKNQNPTKPTNRTTALKMQMYAGSSCTTETRECAQLPLQEMGNGGLDGQIHSH